MTKDLMDDGQLPVNEDPDVTTKIVKAFNPSKDARVVIVSMERKDGEPVEHPEAKVVRRFNMPRELEAKEFVEKLDPNPRQVFGSPKQALAAKAKLLRLQDPTVLRDHHLCITIEAVNVPKPAGRTEPETEVDDDTSLGAEDDGVDSFEPGADDDGEYSDDSDAATDTNN